MAGRSPVVERAATRSNQGASYRTATPGFGWRPAAMTKPRRDKIRQIIATDDEEPACWRRCLAIVSAPASRPASASSLRSATVASSTA